ATGAGGAAGISSMGSGVARAACRATPLQCARAWRSASHRLLAAAAPPATGKAPSMTTTAPIRRIALLTAGGFAPCLSAAVAGLVRRYSAVLPDAEIIAYQYGYHGLLTGTSEVIGAEARAAIDVLDNFGGSPIGNSRVKLTNAKNLVERGLVAEGQDPLQVAAEQLRRDGVDVLHTIGGDDTN